MITILTATLNSADTLPALVASLESQTNQSFLWIVCDGGSTDGTLAILEKASLHLRLKMYVERDFGIYDALNKAVDKCVTDYYLVLGSDDILYEESIEAFLACTRDRPDLISANIVVDGRVRGKSRLPAWLIGQRHFVSSHAVGTVFNKSLHARFGAYSNRYPIAADQCFILRSCMNGAKISYVDLVSGEFGTTGTSSIRTLDTLFDYCRVQIELGFNKYIQLVLLLMRILKNWEKL